jgi:hypothetical protein
MLVGKYYGKIALRRQMNSWENIKTLVKDKELDLQFSEEKQQRRTPVYSGKYLCGRFPLRPVTSKAPHNASCVFTERVNKSAYHLQPNINCEGIPPPHVQRSTIEGEFFGRLNYSRLYTKNSVVQAWFTELCLLLGRYSVIFGYNNYIEKSNLAVYLMTNKYNYHNSGIHHPFFKRNVTETAFYFCLQVVHSEAQSLLRRHGLALLIMNDWVGNGENRILCPKRILIVSLIPSSQTYRSYSLYTKITYCMPFL